MRSTAAPASLVSLVLAGTLAACVPGPTPVPTLAGSSSAAVPEMRVPTTTPREVAVGEAVRIPIDGGGVLVLLLEDVTTSTDCPGRAAPLQTPAQSVFVVLDMKAIFEPDGSLPAEQQFAPTGAEMFRIAGPDGVVHAISSTPESWACFEDSQLLPPFVDSTFEEDGKVVLDSRTVHGLVTYGSSADWYWSF